MALPPRVHPLQATVTPNGDIDFPQLLDTDLNHVIANANYEDKEQVIINTITALALRVKTLTPGMDIPSHVEIEADPISVNDKCEALKLNLNKMIKHLKRMGYNIKSHTGDNSQRVYLISPSDWAYYSTTFTTAPTLD